MTFYILAKDIEDARQWCQHNGVSRQDGVYCGQSWNFPRRFLSETDVLVALPARPEHVGLQRLQQLALGLAGRHVRRPCGPGGRAPSRSAR